MHHTLDAAGRLVERADVTACARCGQPIEPGPMYTTSWASCFRCPSRGHRVHICARDGCNGETFDPPCVEHGDNRITGGGGQPTTS